MNKRCSENSEALPREQAGSCRPTEETQVSFHDPQEAASEDGPAASRKEASARVTKKEASWHEPCTRVSGSVNSK